MERCMRVRWLAGLCLALLRARAHARTPSCTLAPPNFHCGYAEGLPDCLCCNDERYEETTRPWDEDKLYKCVYDPCPPGSSLKDGQGCYWCDLGKYSTEFMSSSCSYCPAGKYTDRVGST